MLNQQRSAQIRVQNYHRYANTTHVQIIKVNNIAQKKTMQKFYNNNNDDDNNNNNNNNYYYYYYYYYYLRDKSTM